MCLWNNHVHTPAQNSANCTGYVFCFFLHWGKYNVIIISPWSGFCAVHSHRYNQLTKRWQPIGIMFRRHQDLHTETLPEDAGWLRHPSSREVLSFHSELSHAHTLPVTIISIHIIIFIARSTHRLYITVPHYLNNVCN